ncbi:FtsX-like permease family protein [Actinomadura sp. WMMB 499]|uniref:FtsX-like permease family protein n=1 Tax=Actinomadura sp. WMMB 499 TaxID=1219491 RepID=UPI001243C1EE|nr:FtsX-like permease family protein [Actinomadura sp. WMMB 499]QFG21216.1 ABC transporter permease [Actinomadura sp. WMMB 499]
MTARAAGPARTARTTLELSWRLLRCGGARNLLGSLLTLAAVAVSTGLLLFALGANHAFAERAAADAWRHPAAPGDGASGTPAAVQALSTDYVRGDPVTVVDLGALSADPPVPPGMPRFPEPGELWASPALAERLADLPAGQLADRFPEPAGTLGDDALVSPGELVAVVGRDAAAPVLTAPRSDTTGLETTAAPTRIDAFNTGTSSWMSVYRVLAGVASALMVAPLLVFGGAAARLTVARRDGRLAALRLVGATPAQVVAITTAEAVLTAAAGAVLGAVLYAAAVPALTHITIQGGGWFAGHLWPGPPGVAAVLAAVPLLVGAGAVAGLRRVVVSPLGVARRETPPALRAVRILAPLAVLVAFGAVSGGLLGMRYAGFAVLLVLMTLAFLTINYAGPWVVSVIGGCMVALARGPSRLLAGRRLRDDPRSVWRTVAGVALTGFVAGFLALLNPGTIEDGASDRLRIGVPDGRDPAAIAARAERRLGGIEAAVSTGDGDGPRGGAKVVTITVPGGAAAVDRARTALHGLVPGRVATTPADDGTGGRNLLGDLRTGALTVLAVSFLIGTTSAGITGASAVLDRRRTYAMLRLAGTPLEVLDRARRQETVVPLAVMGGGSLLAGLFFASPFATGVGAGGALTLAGFVVLGFGGILGASALSRPLLRAVTTDPAPRPD